MEEHKDTRDTSKGDAKMEKFYGEIIVKEKKNAVIFEKKKVLCENFLRSLYSLGG